MRYLWPPNHSPAVLADGPLGAVRAARQAGFSFFRQVNK